MASTYSALKIELIATGEQSGTWGTTTNTNLGDAALGEAITGSADVAFSSADVTVTLTDTNATQAARNLRLNLTGTTGGARSLILGSGCQIEKLYLVNNTCADAITVKNTTGTGIAVPAGKSMFVFNNGTNVVDAVTHATSLTLGSALPVASGGTGSTSTTFVNLASNVTGTLPIANGGTGSSSTTFVNAATNITGTLPLANGGTGATSLAAATIATQGYTTTATAAGTTTLTVSSTQLQYFTGTSTQTVVLPVTSTLTAGQRFEIHNNSTGDVAVQSSGLNAVVTVTGNTTAVCTCILTSGTTAASWDADTTGFTTTVPVTAGGTGVATLTTAYGVLAAGTTATGAVQNLGTGTSAQVLTSNGPGALATWQTASGGQLQTQIFGSPGTWTNPGSVTRVRVMVAGGGGGGAAFSQVRGGGNGGYGNAMITIPTSPVAITIGGFGTGGSFPGAGNSGGTSSFGSYVSCTGGTGANPGTPGSDGAATISGPAATILRPGQASFPISYIYGGGLSASPSPGPNNGVAFSAPGNYGAGYGGPGINSQPGFAAGGTGGGIVVEFVG